MTRTQIIRRKRINDRMDRLQAMLEANLHTKDRQHKETIEHLLEELSPWFYSMNEEDRDYYQCAQDAIEHNIEWVLDSNK